MVNFLELKHEVRQVLSIKTRGAATLIPGNHPKAKRIILAKAGVSVPPDCDDANRFIVDLYYRRYPGLKVKQRPLTSVRDQYLSMSDVLRIEREVRLSYEFDFSCKPVNARMVESPFGGHLAFDTVPWETIEEAERARAIFDGWRKTRCLKTLEDWDDWRDHYQTVIAIEWLRAQADGRLPIQVTAEGSLGILKRIFLRAYAKSTWGLSRSRTFPEVLEDMGKMGFPVSPHDAKNGHKGKLLPNIVPKTPRTEAMLKKLVELFPELQAGNFFIAMPE